jgi:hypothetical protein
MDRTLTLGRKKMTKFEKRPIFCFFFAQNFNNKKFGLDKQPKISVISTNSTKLNATTLDKNQLWLNCVWLGLRKDKFL